MGVAGNSMASAKSDVASACTAESEQIHLEIEADIDTVDTTTFVDATRLLKEPAADAHACFSEDRVHADADAARDFTQPDESDVYGTEMVFDTETVYELEEHDASLDMLDVTALAYASDGDICQFTETPALDDTYG